MHRFYVPQASADASHLEIANREAYHAATVLRLSAGDKATVLNGSGGVFECAVKTCTRDRMQLEVLDSRQVARPVHSVSLLQAIPKARLLEDIIQKAVELGTARVVPLLTERVVIRLDQREANRKAEKWRQVAIEAIKQSGNPWLTAVEPPVTLHEFLARREQFELCLAASLQPGSRHPRHYFERFRNEHARNPKSVAVWIGPEGDFTSVEVETFVSAGALPITLGPLVLRVETAATCSLAIINYELSTDQGS